MALGTPAAVNILPQFEAERYQWLRRKVKLDLMAVDEELMEISTLIQDASDCCAKAIEIRDTAKDDLGRAKAEAARKLRETATPSGKVRSETQITTELLLEQPVLLAQAELNLATADASLWEGLLNTLRTKSYSISTAAELIKAGFISSDYITSKRREEIRAGRS